MLRRIVIVLSLIALSLALVSPALADDPPQPKTTPIPLHGKAFQGTISNKLSDTLWEVATLNYGTWKVDVSGAKLHWPGNKGATAKDFQKGDRVAIKLQNNHQNRGQSRGRGNGPGNARANVPQPGDTLSARMVNLIPGKTFYHFTGEVTGVSISSGAGTVKVKNAQGEEKTFNVGASTVVRPKTKTLADITLGDRVTVVARVADTNNNALAIKLDDKDGDD